MFDNMTGIVGMAMHEDRQATARRNARLAEALWTANPTGMRGRYSREAIAEGLMALAARIAPGAAQTGKVATAS